jgi:hypothetical protein
MIKLADDCKNGRLGNKLLQNVGISVLSKIYNYFPEYHDIEENNLIGLNLFCGKEKKTNFVWYYDSESLKQLLNQDIQNDHGIIYNGYFQDKYFLLNYKKSIDEIVKKREIKKYNEVFVHVRLGDAKHKNPGILYYKNILNSISFDGGLISSDSIDDEIVKKLSEEYNLKIFNSSPIDTIMVGSEYEYRVLSGGTFSWWIGYLGNNNNVFCPATPKFHGDIFVYPEWNRVFLEEK